MPTRSAVILNNLSNVLLFFGGNFAMGLLFAQPVRWAAAPAYDDSILLWMAFATLYVLAGTCFQQCGSWSEILIGTAVIGCVALKIIGATPLLTVCFPLLFLATATAVGLLLMAFGKLERPKLWHTT